MATVVTNFKTEVKTGIFQCRKIEEKQEKHPTRHTVKCLAVDYLRASNLFFNMPSFFSDINMCRISIFVIKSISHASQSHRFVNQWCGWSDTACTQANQNSLSVLHTKSQIIILVKKFHRRYKINNAHDSIPNGRWRKKRNKL